MRVHVLKTIGMLLRYVCVRVYSVRKLNIDKDGALGQLRVQHYNIHFQR